MNLKGTKFQLKVWNYLKKIPKGKVKTYLEVAKAIALGFIGSCSSASTSHSLNSENGFLLSVIFIIEN